MAIKFNPNFDEEPPTGPPPPSGGRKRNTRKRNTRKRNTRKRNTRKRNTRKRKTKRRKTKRRNKYNGGVALFPIGAPGRGTGSYTEPTQADKDRYQTNAFLHARKVLYDAQKEKCDRCNFLVQDATRSKEVAIRRGDGGAASEFAREHQKAVEKCKDYNFCFYHNGRCKHKKVWASRLDWTDYALRWDNKYDLLHTDLNLFSVGGFPTPLAYNAYNGYYYRLNPTNILKFYELRAETENMEEEEEDDLWAEYDVALQTYNDNSQEIQTRTIYFKHYKGEDGVIRIIYIYNVTNVDHMGGRGTWIISEPTDNLVDPSLLTEERRRGYVVGNILPGVPMKCNFYKREGRVAVAHDTFDLTFQEYEGELGGFESPITFVKPPDSGATWDEKPRDSYREAWREG